MHPEFYKLIVAFRRAGVKAELRRPAAAAIVEIASRVPHKELQEAYLADFFARSFTEALRTHSFDVSRAAEAGLIHDNDVYDRTDHILHVCSHVAIANYQVLPDLARAFPTTREFWDAWKFIQGLDLKALEAICEVYSPYGKGGAINWSQKSDLIRMIAPPITVSSQDPAAGDFPRSEDWSTRTDHPPVIR